MKSNAVERSREPQPHARPLPAQRSTVIRTWALYGLLHGVLSVGAFLMAVPFIWMILSSFKTNSEIFALPPTWIPTHFVWANYVQSWQALPFGRAYFNSFYISVTVVVMQLLTCSMAGYAFAKIVFPLRNSIFVIFLAMMMVPVQVIIIPQYLLMRQLGWVDSHLAIIVPDSLFNAFGVFLLRQFIHGIPSELEEAAIMDGASRWTIYVRIILPLIRPALAALAIFSFLAEWNNFFIPLIYLDTAKNYTVPLLLNYFQGQYVTNWPLLLAGSTIAVLPVLVVYILGQHLIIESIALTGMKR